MRHIYILFLLGALFSCADKYDDIKKSDDLKSINQDIILKEPDSHLPKVESKHRIKTRYTNTPLAADDFLGYSYKFNSAITGDPECVGFRILDIEKIKEKYKNYFEYRTIRTAFSESKYYESYSKILHDSTYT